MCVCVCVYLCMLWTPPSIWADDVLLSNFRSPEYIMALQEERNPVKPLFHWSKNPLTPTNIWLVFAMEMDSISIHSRVKWPCSFNQPRSAAMETGHCGERANLARKRWESFSVFSATVTSNMSHQGKGKLLHWQRKEFNHLFSRFNPTSKNPACAD